MVTLAPWHEDVDAASVVRTKKATSAVQQVLCRYVVPLVTWSGRKGCPSCGQLPLAKAAAHAVTSLLISARTPLEDALICILLPTCHGNFLLLHRELGAFAVTRRWTDARLWQRL